MGTRPNIERVLFRWALGVAFALSLSIPVIALIYRGADSPETWAIMAASLAVVTSIVSAWSSRKVIELQEDATLPNPYPTFDTKSRYGLVMITIKNTGGTTAHNVSLEWDIALKTAEGKVIGFLRKDDRAAISVLCPDESISQIIDVDHKFIKSLPNTAFTGKVLFEDTLGNSYEHPFRLDGRQYENTPSYDVELTRTLFELQRIPRKIEILKGAVDKLNK